MKVGILAIYDYVNFGNRLQSYALKNVVENLGYDTTLFEIVSCKTVDRKFKWKRLWSKKFRNLVKWYKEKIPATIIDRYSFRHLKKIGQDLDCVILGSDQVFCHTFIIKPKVTFLKFVPAEKRHSYASSFGVSALNPKFIKIYKKGLEGFQNISLREQESLKFLDELHLDKSHATANLDPTLLLDANEWLKITSPRLIKEKYIVIYAFEQVKEEYAKVYELAKKHSLRVINALEEREEPYTMADFLSLIYNAELVCTNSFHGTVFSIIFNKPFVEIDKIGWKYSRIANLKSALQVPDRDIKKLSEKDIFEMDYSKINQNLTEKRQKNIDFLHDMIKGAKNASNKE